MDILSYRPFKTYYNLFQKSLEPLSLDEKPEIYWMLDYVNSIFHYHHHNLNIIYYLFTNGTEENIKLTAKY